MFRLFIAFLLFFIAPMAAAAAWWSMVDRPANWRQADWSATGLLPPAQEVDGAVLHIMAARTGGLKGAFSVHSWIVFKEAGSDNYQRFDKVGWGSPVRQNAYAADANWYSNPPFIIKTVRGDRASTLLPDLKTAIANYPHAERGGYRIWPGPNSNSFVAHVLREVPAIGAVLPPHAVGKDWLSGGEFLRIDPDGREAHITLFGLAGISVGARSGFELHFLGQTAGVDVLRPALKLPAIGRIGMPL
ncbi:MAG: DUF3750 domain-containing protein [Pseudomonadota bacterium]